MRVNSGARRLELGHLATGGLFFLPAGARARIGTLRSCVYPVAIPEYTGNQRGCLRALGPILRSGTNLAQFLTNLL